jgi:hypothetical protein
MANPDPEILPEEAEPYVRVMATGRSDYPNQINNVLCFPGFFRGLLDAHATTVNEEMKIAAAEAIAAQVTDRELHEEYIIPSVFNRHVARAVSRAVTDTAYRTGAAVRHRRVRRHLWPLALRPSGSREAKTQPAGWEPRALGVWLLSRHYIRHLTVRETSQAGRFWGGRAVAPVVLGQNRRRTGFCATTNWY